MILALSFAMYFTPRYRYEDKYLHESRCIVVSLFRGGNFPPFPAALFKGI